MPRSRGDRVWIAWRSSLDRGASTKDASDAAIDDDRATIARQSGHDRTSIVVLRKKCQPFDEEQVSRPMICLRSNAHKASRDAPPLMEIGQLS